MAKKVLLWTVFVVFVGILVAGALIRTQDRMTRTAEAQGTEHGAGQGAGRGEGQGAGRGEGQGAGRGEGQGAGRGEGQGVGEGTGQGAGRGEGQGAGRGEGHGVGEGTGQGAGLGSAGGSGQGQGSGSESERAAVWNTVEGVVTSIDDAEMTVTTSDGEIVLVEGRPWQFVVDQGFEARVGDAVALRGFLEDGEFKTGQIDDTTNGQRIQLRDETGRPGWAGQGRRQSGS